MCHQYGWTLDQFFIHTTRELFYLYRQLHKRLQSERENANDMREIDRQFYAAMHGIKYVIPEKKETKKVENTLTLEQQQAVDKHLEKRIKEKQQEMRQHDG